MDGDIFFRLKMFLAVVFSQVQQNENDECERRAYRRKYDFLQPTTTKPWPQSLLLLLVVVVVVQQTTTRRDGKTRDEK